MDFSTLPGRVSLIHSPAEVEKAVLRLAEDLNATLADTPPDKPVVLLCIMTGSIVFAGKLLPYLVFPLELDYLHASRYGQSTVGGELDWIVRPRQSLQGRTVVLVDDILDEGVTLHHIQEHCRREGASRVLTTVLVNKLRARKMEVHVDFTGLDVPDSYVFGYGMDCSGLWRNAPGIFALHFDHSSEV